MFFVAPKHQFFLHIPLVCFNSLHQTIKCWELRDYPAFGEITRPRWRFDELPALDFDFQQLNVNPVEPIRYKVSILLGELSWINIKVICGFWNINALAESRGLVYFESQYHGDTLSIIGYSGAFNYCADNGQSPAQSSLQNRN